MKREMKAKRKEEAKIDNGNKYKEIYFYAFESSQNTRIDQVSASSEVRIVSVRKISKLVKKR